VLFRSWLHVLSKHVTRAARLADCRVLQAFGPSGEALVGGAPLALARPLPANACEPLQNAAQVKGTILLMSWPTGGAASKWLWPGACCMAIRGGRQTAATLHCTEGVVNACTA